ncbi:MAG: hypothetical protein NC453_30380 [Muribaculum sp.]|nr:hypothetical protein [Muribaculum sp.]
MRLYHKALLPFLFLTLFFHCSYAQTQQYDSEKQFAEIEKAISVKEWNKADSLISDAIRQSPDDALTPLLLSNLGMIRYYAGKDSLAVATLTYAHTAAPSSVTILANRAKVLTAMGQTDAAIHDYNAIEQLDSIYSDTYLYRGLLRLYSGQFEDALLDLQKREELSPRNEDTLIAMASFYTITENYENAISYYSQLIKADPQAEYYAGRAMCALQLDRLVDASEDIADGLELDPGYSELFLCRAILNKKRYCKDDARSDADTAIQLGANPARVNALLGTN